jgi:hypothetical protein
MSAALKERPRTILPEYIIRSPGLGSGLRGMGTSQRHTRHRIVVRYADGRVTQQDILCHFEEMARVYARSTARGVVVSVEKEQH